jgi:ribosomal protein S18 acetylase RimI-like enzyme
MRMPLGSTDVETVVIRTARMSDAKAIAHIRVAAWRVAYRGLMPDSYLNRPDLEHTEAEQLRNRLHNIRDLARVSVAEMGGQLVGYCAYGSAELSRGDIYDLYVHPDAWHRGVGRQLLVIATELFKAQGFAEATLFVFEGNSRARNFYEQAGWSADGYRTNYERPEFTLPVLRYRTTCS